MSTDISLYDNSNDFDLKSYSSKVYSFIFKWIQKIDLFRILASPHWKESKKY